MNTTTKNVFVSHVHEDDASLKELAKLLASKGYQIKDSSITSAKPNEASNENYNQRLRHSCAPDQLGEHLDRTHLSTDSYKQMGELGD